jgi:hypothetical protein
VLLRGRPHAQCVLAIFTIKGIVHEIFVNQDLGMQHIGLFDLEVPVNL